MTAPLRKNVSSTAKITRLTSARCSHDSSLMPYRLYPIFRRNSLRAAISAGPSTPFVELPSITPITPRPCSVFAPITSTGLAVAQKNRKHLGDVLHHIQQVYGICITKDEK